MTDTASRLSLYSRPPSPFGRKVLAAAELLGLTDRLDIYTPDDTDAPHGAAPLGKIPVLGLEDGRLLYDSRVILEYLDSLAGGGRIIPAVNHSGGDARFEALRQAALADGILEAALLVVYEGRYRPDLEPYEPWLDFQRRKIGRGLADSAANPPSVGTITVGAIGLACALEYIDFRKPYDWRSEFPALIDWLAGFNAAFPEFAQSAPSD